MKIKDRYPVFLSCFFFFFFFNLEAQVVVQDFSAIEEGVNRCPKKLNNDLPALTAYLEGLAENELGKVRAIYSWITTHIAYDWKALKRDKRINHFTKDILERKVALCYGYAQLFKEMCDSMDITSVMVNGYAKGTAATDFPLEQPNHSWNAVQIQGNWYVLDATWGSSTIDQDEEFVQITNNDYFLIQPENFVYTHLPGNPMWQLLPDPVPVVNFMESDTAVYQHLMQADTTFAFEDSIKHYFQLSPARRRLLDHERTYQFHPTQDNGRELGHALIDYAGIISDTLELLSPEEDLEKIIAGNKEIIQYCRQANSLVRLYPWQHELFINALINQAVITYNHHDLTDETKDHILNLLSEAKALLANSEPSFFSKMAKEKCDSYIDIIEDIGQ